MVQSSHITFYELIQTVCIVGDLAQEKITLAIILTARTQENSYSELEPWIYREISDIWPMNLFSIAEKELIQRILA